MLSVNGHNINIYELDTKDSIISRISAYFHTLPKYLYFEEEFQLPLADQKLDYKMEDLLQIIVSVDNYTLMYDKIKDKIKHTCKKLNYEKDVLEVWVSNLFKTSQGEIANGLFMMKISELEAKGELKDIDPNSLIKFWNARTTIKDNLMKKIELVRDQNTKLEDLYNIFRNIVHVYPYTGLTIDRVTVDVFLNLKELNLLDMFNNVYLSEETPFAYTGNYYKILKNFVPSNDWNGKEENVLVCKVNNKNKVNINRERDYGTVELKISGELGNEEVVAKMRILTERGYLSREKFIERYFNIFPALNITYTKVDETEILGTFFFPNKSLNIYVLSDLIMNDPFFSILLNVDESAKTTKQRAKDISPWLNIHFNSEKTGRMTVRISERYYDGSSTDIGNIPQSTFVVGQPYIRVRIKSKDVNSIQIFQIIFSKLLVLYTQKEPEIISIYRTILPDFGEEKKVEVKVKSSKLTGMDSDIYTRGASRQCTGARKPTIIPNEEVKAYEDAGYEVMRFPKPSEDTISGKERIRNFVCTDKSYIYPGVIVNKGDNKEKYPYIPCCFQTKQSEKKNTNYDKYYNDAVEETKGKVQTDLIKTKKFLDLNKYGVLSETLIKLFSMIDTDPFHKYIRTGVDREEDNKSSFVQAILLATRNIDYMNTQSNSASRKQYVQAYRLFLADYAVLARQGCYSMTTDQIVNEMKDFSVYIDPKKYVQLFQYVFQVNIYIFNSEGLSIPTFSQGYYYPDKTYDNSILIYEHWGSESDHAEYPQCELIACSNTENMKELLTYFSSSTDLSVALQNIQKTMVQSYSLNREILPTIFPEFKDVTGQYIDSYGKCRQIDLFYKNNMMTILTSPMAPLNLPEKKNTDVNFITVDMAKDFIQEYKGDDISQTTLANYVKEINCYIGNVFVSIPVHPEPELSDMRVYDNNALSYTQKSLSETNIYNYNKKTTRYIIEYLFWLFSIYVAEHNIQIINDDVLNDFSVNKIKIDEKVNYGTIGKILSLNNTAVENGKLLVKNEETLKRLMYVLKLYSVRDLHSLLNYRTHNVISQYYLDVTDFEQYENQIILYGDDALDKWIQDNRKGFVMENKILLGQKSPYFFKNDRVEDDVFLAQNANSLEHAMYISVFWEKNKYNPGIDSKGQETQYSYDLYVYENQNVIQKTRMQGTKEGKNIKIVVQKISEHSYHYTSLLSF